MNIENCGADNQLENFLKYIEQEDSGLKKIMGSAKLVVRKHNKYEEEKDRRARQRRRKQ